MANVGVFNAGTGKFTDDIEMELKSGWKTKLRKSLQSRGWTIDTIASPIGLENMEIAKATSELKRTYDQVAIVMDSRTVARKSGTRNWNTLHETRNYVDELAKEERMFDGKDLYGFPLAAAHVAPSARIETKEAKPATKTKAAVPARDQYHVSGGPYVPLVRQIVIPPDLSADQVRKRREKYKKKGKPYVEPKGVVSGKMSLFTFTSKMNCPSFSLPAGPRTKGGSCDAAKETSALKLEGAPKGFSPRQHHDSLTKGRKSSQPYICDLCYAGKNQYLAYKTTGLSQRLLMKWTEATLAIKLMDREPTMSEASGPYTAFEEEVIRGIEFLRSGTFKVRGQAGRASVNERLSSHMIDTRFFRVHDSGDFFREDYYRAWCRIAKHFYERDGKVLHRRDSITFWAPTRQWVFKKWRDEFKRYAPPPNFTIRPSGLFVESKPPTIDSLSSGSMSMPFLPDDAKQCPAYSGGDADSCVENSSGSVCRHCWSRPDRPVNYWTH